MRTLKLLKRLFSKKVIHKLRTTLEYIDRQGNKWYSFNNILDMSMDRKLMIDEAQRFMELNITKDKLLKIIVSLKDKISNKKNDDAFVTVANLEARLSLKAETETCLQLCAIIFLINNEPLTHFDNKYYEQKLELLTNDIELRNFFFQLFLIKYKSFTQQSAQDFINYLKKATLQINLLNRLT